MDKPPPKQQSGASDSLIDQLDSMAAAGGLNNKAEEAIQKANKQLYA